MATIRRQSILSLVFIYAGFLIGAVNILVLFPRYFSTEEFGLTRLLLELGLLLSTLCTFGMAHVSIKFFPFYKKYLPKSKNDLMFLTLGVCLLALIAMMLILPAVKPLVVRKFGYRSPLFVEHFDLLFPLTIGMTLFGLMEGYAWIIGRTATANFLKEFLFRLLTTLLIGAVVVGLIKNFSVFASLFSLTYLPPMILLAIVVFRSGEFPLHTGTSHVTRRLGWRMAGFGTAIFASSVLNSLAKTNDSIILASQSTGGLSDTAVYSIATYLVTLMEVPQRSLTGAAAPQIAIAWRERNTRRLLSIYHKTALNLLIIGLALFGLLLLNIPQLKQFLGQQFDSIGLLLTILGVAKIIDLGTGLNAHVLMLSKHWKIDLLTNVVFVGISFVLNYLLTKKLGILGPAWGTLTAVIFYNLMRFLVIWKLFKLQPFTWANLKALVLVIPCFLVASIIPDTGNLYLDVIIPSVIFTILFSFLIVKFRVSEDIGVVADSVLKRFSRLKD